MMKKVGTKIWGMGLACTALLLCASPFSGRIANLPQHITLLEGQKQSFRLDFPFSAILHRDDVVNAVESDRHEVQITTLKKGQTQLDIALMGWLPVRSIQIQVVENDWVVVGGQCVGVEMESRGVLVVNTSSFTDQKGETVSPGRSAGIKKGDQILKVNGQTVNQGRQFASLVKDAADRDMEILYCRDGKEFQTNIRAVRDESDGQWHIGLWVRDGTAGIGTLTYYDPQNDAFGALGHGVVDAETGVLFPMKKGSLYEANVFSIISGKAGNPGELQGSFDAHYGLMGKILDNSNLGIYGVLNEPLRGKMVQIASRDQVSLGRAEILCTLSGQKVQSYQVEIIRLYPQSNAAEKGMVIKAVDEELLRKTGGIVQGMSGSPILQNGYLVGAVTHVFINDPTMGHGIYIEWMLEHSNALSENKKAG